jgi:2-iminobutanoate/2-iminopropanoate deaminase
MGQILNGTNPGDIPFIQVTRVYLALNGFYHQVTSAAHLKGGRNGCISQSAGLLIGLVGFALLCATPATAENDQVLFYNSPAATAAKLPFSQAVRVGDVLYMSGAIGLLPGKRELVPGGIEPETKQVMDNIGEVLKANALTFDDVFKCTVMLAHMFNWGAFNKIYVTYFKPERLPARSAFGANGLALDAEVELECWAFARK